MTLIRTTALLLSGLFCMAIATADVLITEVTANTASRSKPPPAILSVIANGKQFSLEDGVQAVAVDLSSGREYLASGPGIFRVDGNAVTSVSQGQVTLRQLPVGHMPEAKVAVARVSRAAMVMRTAPSLPPRPLSPLNTVVLSTTPSFQWTPVYGADSYQFSLYDADGQTVLQTKTTMTRLDLPPAVQLVPAAQYQWTIKVINDNVPRAKGSSKAEFTVVAADVALLLAKLKPTASSSLSARVLYAAQVQEAGAVEEARLLWQILAKEHPADASLQALAQ